MDRDIDDGLHSPNANLATLVFGLSRLNMEGCLVIEDISPDAVPLWQIVSAALLPDSYESSIVAAAGAFLFVVRRLKWKKSPVSAAEMRSSVACPLAALSPPVNLPTHQTH
jgi:hypothetical protein